MNIRGKKTITFGHLLHAVLFNFYCRSRSFFWESSVLGASPSLEKGNLITSASAIGEDGGTVALDNLRGNMTLINVVP